MEYTYVFDDGTKEKREFLYNNQDIGRKFADA